MLSSAGSQHDSVDDDVLPMIEFSFFPELEPIEELPTMKLRGGGRRQIIVTVFLYTIALSD